MRSVLSAEIDGDETSAATKPFRDALAALKTAEATLKAQKDELKRLEDELELKVEFKLFGTEDKLEKRTTLLTTAEAELTQLGGPPPETAKKGKGEPKPTKTEKAALDRRKALAKDIATLKATITRYHNLVHEIGGIITTEQARELILDKHHGEISKCLTRYVQAEERALFALFENLSNQALSPPSGTSPATKSGCVTLDEDSISGEHPQERRTRCARDFK